MEISTGELQEILAMWRDVQRLVNGWKDDELVTHYGADFAAHLDIGDLPTTIARLDRQIAERS